MHLKNILLLEPINTPSDIISKEKSTPLTDKKKALVAHMARLAYIKYKLRLTSVHSIPLSLAQLSSIVKESGINTFHIPFILEALTRFIPDHELEKRIASFDYDTAWLSVGSPEAAYETFRYAKIIKKINADTPIMIGGVLPSTYPEFFLTHPEIDYLVRGPAEIAIRQYIHDPSQENYKKIQGFCYRTNSEQLNISPSFAKEPDLNKIPPFDLEGLSIEKYMKNNHFCNIQTSRGCPFDCPFCCHANFWGLQVKYRPIEHVKKELTILQEHGCNAGYIVDSTFTLDKTHVKKFVDMYEHEHLSIKLAFETRADLYSEEIAKITKTITPFYIWFGGESGAPEILSRLKGKDHKQGKAHIKNMFKAVENAKKNELLCGSSWVIGLPGEDKHTIQQTKKFIIDLSEAGMDAADIRILQIFPGTPYYKNPEAWGLTLVQKELPDQNISWEKYAGHATEKLSPKEIVAGAEEIREELYNYYMTKMKQKK